MKKQHRAANQHGSWIQGHQIIFFERGFFMGHSTSSNRTAAIAVQAQPTDRGGNSDESRYSVTREQIDSVNNAPVERLDGGRGERRFRIQVDGIGTAEIREVQSARAARTIRTDDGETIRQGEMRSIYNITTRGPDGKVHYSANLPGSLDNATTQARRLMVSMTTERRRSRNR